MSKYPETVVPAICGALALIAVPWAAPANGAGGQAQPGTLSTGDPAQRAEGGFGLGREALPEEIAAWEIDVRPDGAGLPEGSGDVWTGEQIFLEQCAVCHGDFAEGVGRWPVLAGGEGTLTNARPVKTIGSYWPYLSTVFDYFHRAMPFGYAQSLEPDEVYAIIAYLLYSNYIVDEDFVLGHENFADVSLPNEDNFFMDDRATGETPEFSGELCMTDCKETVEITARAASLDVTPEDAAARKAREAEAATAQAGAEDGKQMAAVEAPPPEEAADAYHDGLDPPLVAQGEKAFRQCQACHMVGEEAQNRVGPVLTGIVGAPAGNIDGFDYSNVLREAAADGLVWTEETLSAFLADPRSYMEGTKMSFAGLTRDAEVAAVIAFLKAKSP